MKLHRFNIRPLSPWSIPLNGDTLCGLLLWRIAESYDGAKCAQYIEAFRSGKPPFVVSSAMPKDMLPMPSLPPVASAYFISLISAHGITEEKLIAGRKALASLSKTKWMPVDIWQGISRNLSAASIFSWYWENICESLHADSFEPGKIVYEAHASPNINQANTFFRRVTWFGNTVFHIYARTEDPAWLLHLLATVGNLGFGAGASTGNGRFEVELDENFDTATLDFTDFSPNTCSFLLSPCAGKNMSTIEGWYRLKVKRGKAGLGMSYPYKNPILYICEGAIMRRLPLGPYVIDNIQPCSSVAQIMEPLTLPCILAEDA